MQEHVDFRLPSPVPSWLTPADARTKLAQITETFVREAAVPPGTDAADAQALALQVTAGLGKTSTVLRAVARHANALLARGHVLFYVPTLELAERACADLLRINPDVPARVIRGRQAPRANSKAPMCEKHELARKISGFVPSVTQALCRAKGEDGRMVEATCACNCPYLQQKDVTGAHVVFLSHAYLTVDPPIDRDIKVALRVVDEKVWPTLTSVSEIRVDLFMRGAPPHYPDEERARLSSAKAAIVDCLQQGLPLASHVRRSGISTAHLEALKKAENASRESLDLAPWLAPETFAFRTDTFDVKSFAASRTRERIFGRLAEKESGVCPGITLVEKGAQDERSEHIQVCSMRQIERDAPLLLLDADADPLITEKITPGAEFVSIQSPPVANIVQISDRTLSDSWLLDETDGFARRARVRSIIRREVERVGSRRALVVTTKTVLTAFTQDAEREGHVGPGGQADPFFGAFFRWFGPNTHGVNDFEDFETVVIVGRLQPRVPTIEAAARAIFHDEDLPIETYREGPLPAQETLRLFTDGRMESSTVRAHPDPRASSVLAQFREHASLQAIARLRLASPRQKKRVVILSNMALPGFPVSRLATLQALEVGLEEEPDVAGYMRMEKALRAIADRPVRGTRLSACGLVEDLPRDFTRSYSAKHFRRGRTTPSLVDLCDRICRRNRWPMTQLTLRPATGGQSVPAIVLEPRGKALAAAGALWPGFEPKL